MTTLVGVAGLGQVLEADLGKDAVFNVNWTTTKDWSEHARYERHGEQEARELIDAVGDKNHRVMQSIKQHW